MFDREIVATFFGFQEALKPRPEKRTWTDFVSELRRGHLVIPPARKEWSWHFNLSEFKPGGRRQNSDVLLSHGLVIDYDANVSIAQALARFGTEGGYGFEFALFTSFNHQRKKHEDDYIRDKFRVVLPFAEPMPGQDYQRYKHYLPQVFAPGCDSRLAVVSQLYAWLYCPEENKHLAQVIHRPGVALDWRTWPVDSPANSPINTSTQGKSVKRKALYLEPTDTIRLKGGEWITVQDIDRHISGAYCPFHDDKSPGAFVNKSPRGSIYLRCHKCGTAHMRREREQAGSLLPLKSNAGVPVPAKPAGPVEEPYDREKREKLLIRSCIEKWDGRNLLLYAFEGFGKSRLCPLLAQVARLGLAKDVTYRHYLRGDTRPCIVFATKSNKQAVEQAESFRGQTITPAWNKMVREPISPIQVQLITGRVYNLQEYFSVDAPKDEGTHPWDVGDINQKRTLAAIQEQLECTPERAQEIWQESAADEPDFDNHDIVVTTHERVRAWGRIQDQSAWRAFDNSVVIENKVLPDGTIIFIDDPDRSDFLLLAPYDEKYVRTRVEGRTLDQVQIGDYRYFVRPDLYHLDSGLHNAKLIFTTTEMVTRQLMEKNFPGIYIPELMPPNRMRAGEIAIISTDCVHASRDGLMLALVHALKRDGMTVTLIGDGMGAEWNHQSNKGVNSIDSDLLIEISFPTPKETTLLANELYGSVGNLRGVQIAIALDRMHQAIGRVGGYRFSDKPESERKRCVVLCDPKMRDALVEETRYYISHTEHADAWREGGLKKPDDLYGLVSWYLRNMTRWITERGGRYFLSDVRRAVGSTSDKRRVERLLTALKTVEKDITGEGGSSTDPKASAVLEEAISWLENEKGQPKPETAAA